MFKNPFSFKGRIRRTEFGITFLIFWISNACIRFYYEVNNGENPLLALAYLPLLWFLFAQGAKREHDLGFSGWWQLIPFRHFWLIIQKGEVGENKFGNNPKDKLINIESYS